MANALQLFKILYKTQHKPVHKLWLRFEENEVNDKSGKGGGGGTILGICSSNRVFKILVSYREWFAQKLDMFG